MNRKNLVIIISVMVFLMIGVVLQVSSRHSGESKIYEDTDNQLGNKFQPVAGRVSEYRTIEDSQRNGSPAVTETTKVYGGVEVRAYEMLPMTPQGIAGPMKKVDLGISTFTNSEGEYELWVPLNARGERYIKIYLPENPFSGWQDRDPEISGVLLYLEEDFDTSKFPQDFSRES